MRSSGLQTLFTHLGLPHRQELRPPDCSRSTKRSFLEHFNIISVGRAEALDRRDSRERIVCDVIVIDDSDEDDPEMELQYHHRPVSPKGLISSVGKNFKRSSSIYQSIERKNAVVLKRGGDTIATSHSSEKLLRIDVSSPLGQRLREHVGTLNRSKFEPCENERRPLSNGSGVLNIRSSFNDRLRRHSDYRITFRPSRQQCLSYSHAYKFTNRQRKEFCHAFDSGLSVRARRMLRRMKPCRVEVQKLPPETYRFNIPESKLTSNQNRVFLQIRQSVVLLAKSDCLTGGSTLNADRYDLNRSKIVNCQTMSNFSSEDSTRETTAVRPTTDINQCHFNSEVSVTVTSASLVTANEVSFEVRQQSTQVCSASNAAENFAIGNNSDLVLVDSAGVCNENSNRNSDDSSVSTVCNIVTDCQHFPDLLAVTTASSNVELDASPSVNSLKVVVQTADKDCQTTDCGISMEELPTSKRNTSGWSMSGDLPALSFLCNICGDVVSCESDSKSLIFNHYSGHGITNIDLMEETMTSGEKVIKLIELPVEKANSSKTTLSQATSVSTAADLKSSNKSILVQPHSSSRAEDVEFGFSNTVSAVRAQKKGRRVTWADEQCNTVTQQSQRVPSPLCLNAAQQDVTMSLSEQRKTSCSSQETVLLNNGSEVSALCSGNNVTTAAASVALRTYLEPSVVDSSLCSTAAVRESIPYSFPVSSSSDTVSSAIPCLIPAKTSSKRARLFWSNSSIEGRTSFRSPSSVAGHPDSSYRPVSTALTLRSKRAANGVLISTSAPVGEVDYSKDGVCRSRKSLPLSTDKPSGHSTLADDSNMSTRDNLCTPVMARTRIIKRTLNNCRQSYLQETNVICID